MNNSKWNKYAKTTGYILGRPRDDGFCMSKYEYLGYDEDTGEVIWEETPNYSARSTYCMALNSQKIYPDSTIIQVTYTFEERV